MIKARRELTMFHSSYPIISKSTDCIRKKIRFNFKFV